MNERINELAEQAGFYVSANGAEILIPDPHTEDITGVLEKFAELIVRECSTLAYDGPNGILEHFGLGVEE